ncbi:transcription initiation factor TFIID component TAF4 family-domain-containing protein [Ephemerocybe angulata]|uniref:Transcription initiation factor TFIID subunit 4 n=1 Tax=Ephemerocybe angulata TaxID=980116 RepID=A0A8H6LUE1_9AGAR|nr:transcription initiation factor TFIID component TAF4 family-domain-containing protein [Tulosesus angulatus]
MVIDPQLQAVKSSMVPVTTPTTSTNQATIAAYYQAAAYQHYPQHYQYHQSYLAAQQQQQQQAQQAQQAQQQAQQQQAQQHQHQHQQAAAAPITQRATFSVATTPAPPTPVTAVHTPAVATTAQTATATAAAAAAANNNSLDTSDLATLNDALGSAGVDLRAEEESLQRHDLHFPSHLQTNTSIYLQNRQYEDRSRKQSPKPAFNTQTLGATMRTIGAEYKVTRIPEDAVNYMALALRARMQDLVTAMIEAGRYRKEAQFDRPASMYEGGGEETAMWSIVVRSDVAKQLAVLERVEREDELRIRRERKERQEMTAQHTANLVAQANGAGMVGIESGGNGGMGGGMGGGGMDEEGGAPKKKKKKDGPGVTARNLSEDVRKKMSNAVATQAAGLGKYSWMTAGAGSAPAVKKAATPAGTGAGAGGSSWAKPYVPKKPQPEKTPTAATTPTTEEEPGKVTVTMRDAVFVLEKERGHGGGRGSARGWK